MGHWRHLAHAHGALPDSLVYNFIFLHINWPSGMHRLLGHLRESQKEGTDMTDELDRHFEGNAVLNELLAQAGSLADAQDVYGAFVEAVQINAPPAAVIEALWEDEPRFASPQIAKRTFSNLLGLYDAVLAGSPKEALGLASSPKKHTRRIELPEPLVNGDITPAQLDAYLQYLDDRQQERTRLLHQFDNTWNEPLALLEAEVESDEVWGVLIAIGGTLYAVSQLAKLPPRHTRTFLLEDTGQLPDAIVDYVEDTLAGSGLDDVALEAAHPLTLGMACTVWPA
jgi:hypothetical protein